MTQQTEQTLLTPEVKALIGQTSEVREMHGVVDAETVRRYIIGIPDQDPRHWDEELAKPRFGTTTTPPAMVSYITNRKPPWEEDRMSEIMLRDPFDDGGGGMGRQGGRGGGSRSLRELAGIRSFLHAGDEIEIRQYPKIGDRIFSQSKTIDIQEKKSRDGRPFLLSIGETRYWNQNDEVLMIKRTIGIQRP